MTDGCSDGWAGRIPVCALSGTSQQQGNVNGKCVLLSACDREASIMMERDYISLGLTGVPQEDLPSSVADDKLKCDNVELSLGLGRSDKSSAQDGFTAEQTPSAVDGQVMPRCGAKLQQFWHQNFRVSLSNDRAQQVANRALLSEPSSFGSSSYGASYPANVVAPVWGPVPGRFTVPVPKLSTTPAKRPYQDTTAAELAPFNALNSIPAAYSWNSDLQCASTLSAAGWQLVHANFEQARAYGTGANPASHGYGLGHGQLGGAPSPSSAVFKVPQAPSSASVPQPSLSNGGPPPSQGVHVSAQPEPECEGNQSKAPVVGWPPVRTYRRNTLQSVHLSSRMSAEDLAKGLGGASSSLPGDVLQESMNNTTAKNGFFVKAKLDGVRICRKVDLKAYDSYDGLKVALQEMFQVFVSDVAKLDLVTGKNYVLTHEDKDGDCLLVGDVPWHMFLESSVKSLRIMKATDATGIGEKGLTKLKAQEDSKL